ncbi:MAG: hypothetical protein EXR76_09130 [Myxococcales bacterium]|nr:hypothetical protein [Myxococcales bacterium]
MNPEVMDLVVDALRLVVSLSLPVLGATVVSGLLSGLLTGLTGWTEGTLSHPIRVFCVAAALLFSAGELRTSMLTFATRAWGGP